MSSDSEKKRELEKKEYLETQTGGHIGAFVILEGEEKIMKACNGPELVFYKSLNAKYSFLVPFAPGFHGTTIKNNREYIIMDDLTCKYHKPCVMDIKMGITTADEDASEEKRKSMEEKDKESTTATLGIRITGLKVWNTKKNDYDNYHKGWGRKVVADTMTKSLALFFQDGNGSTLDDVVEQFLIKLKEVEKWQEEQQVVRLYSSSLLFLYDGDRANAKSTTVTLKMIDFAHVFDIKDKGRDEGYLTGLKNLIRYMSLLKEKK